MELPISSLMLSSVRSRSALMSLAAASFVAAPTTGSVPRDDRPVIERAIDAIRAEQELAAKLAPGMPSPPDADALSNELRRQDLAGTLILTELVAKGFDVSPSVQAVLGPLPKSDRNTKSEQVTPEQYAEAVAQLVGASARSAGKRSLVMQLAQFLVMAGCGAGAAVLFRRIRASRAPEPVEAAVAAGTVAADGTSLHGGPVSDPNGFGAPRTWTDELAATPSPIAETPQAPAETPAPVPATASKRRFGRRQQESNELPESAYQDELTGLGNRRRLDRDIVGYAASLKWAVGVLVVGIDSLSDFQRRHSAEAADDALQRTGEMLAKEIRRGDVVYRYGDGEFCVLLPGATISETNLVAERLRSAAERLELSVEETITISVGVSIGPATTVRHTLSTADAALDEAKREGSNRICVGRAQTAS